jgi:hypothetical protein
MTPTLIGSVRRSIDKQKLAAQAQRAAVTRSSSLTRLSSAPPDRGAASPQTFVDERRLRAGLIAPTCSENQGFCNETSVRYITHTAQLSVAE